MAITDFDSYKEMQAGSSNVLTLTKNMISFTAGRFGSMFLSNPFGGSAPTTAVALDSTSAGAPPAWKNGGTNPLRLVRVNYGYYLNASIMIIDRLSHQGGLSGTVATAQTTNLPTAALTRYTSGVGVHMGLQIYSAIGTTATTVTVSYTNSAGASGQTSIPTAIGSAAYNAASIIIPLPLQEGDVGVQSVESVTLAASTVSAAGNFGVVLYKPLVMMPVSLTGAQSEFFDPLLNGGVNMPEFLDDTFLDFMIYSGATGSGGSFNANLRFAEDR